MNSTSLELASVAPMNNSGEALAGGAAEDRTPEDRVLMDRAKTGDQEALRLLFERHEGRLRRLAYLMLHDQDAAEDVVQDTFERCILGIRSYRGDGVPVAWLSSIAINVCRHQLRAAKIRPSKAPETEVLRGRPIANVPTRGAVTRAIFREELRRLAIAMGSLTQAQREVFILHYQEDFPYADVGQILGISAGAARAIAHRAKATLRKNLLAG